MPFSNQLIIQYQDLIHDYFDKLVFNEIKEFDEFNATTQGLIDPSKSESKATTPDIKGLKELLDHGFDKFVTQDIVEKKLPGTKPGEEIPAFTPNLREIRTPEGKELEVKVNKATLIQEARDEFKKILVESIRTKLNDVKDMTPEVKQEYIKMQKIRNPFEAALKSLQPFSTDPTNNVKADEFISDIKKLESGESSEKELEALNKKLENFLKESKVQENFFRKTIEVIFQTLPHNVLDFSTFESIPSAARIITSDRYQFDINALVHWINTKQKYENPTTRVIFSKADQIRIDRLARKYNLNITVGGIFHAEENAAMLAGVLSAIQNEGQNSGSMLPVYSIAMGAALGEHRQYAEYLRQNIGANVNDIAQSAARSGSVDAMRYAQNLFGNNAGSNAESGPYVPPGGRLGFDFAISSGYTSGRSYRSDFFRRFVEQKRDQLSGYRSSANTYALIVFDNAVTSENEAVKTLLNQEQAVRSNLLHGTSDQFKRVALTGPAAARIILENESLSNKLLSGSNEEKSTVLKELANANSRTAQCILESKPLRSLLLNGSARDNATFLHNLAKKDVSYANYILNDSDVLRDIILTPENNAEKAERFSYWMERNPKQVGAFNLFEEPFRSIVLDGSEQEQAKRLELMVSTQFSSGDAMSDMINFQAKHVLEEKPLLQKLLHVHSEVKEPQRSKEIANRLKKIATKNPSAARYILKTESLRSMLLQGNDDERFAILHDLACSHLFNLVLILEEEKDIILRGNSLQQANTLRSIATHSRDSEVAIYSISTDPNLRDILLQDAKADNIELLTHYGAKTILENKSTRDILLSGDDNTKANKLAAIASHCNDNAHFILEEKSPYRDMILSGPDNDQMTRLEVLAKSRESGRIVLEDKALCAKLLSGSPEQQAEKLTILACTPPTSKAAYILEKKPLRDKLLQGDAKLTAERLVRIASSDPGAALQILGPHELQISDTGVLRQALLTGTPAEQLIRLGTIATALFKDYSHHPVMTRIDALSKQISDPFFAPPRPDAGRSVIM